MLASWNIRGLNDPSKQSAVRKLIAEQKLWAVGLIEIRVRNANVDKVWTGLKLRNWHLLSNQAYYPLGRIWLSYNPSVISITLLNCAAQFLHCFVTWQNYQLFWTIIYGANCCDERRDL